MTVDAALADVREQIGRLQLELAFARLVMGDDKHRHELLAAIAALDPVSYRDFVKRQASWLKYEAEPEHQRMAQAITDWLKDEADAHL